MQSLDELKKKLDPEAYRITQEKATERPFTGKYNEHFEVGTYVCIVCGATLFTSETKYDSGCGWPAFYDPVSKDSLKYQEDTSHGMRRIEIMCGNCDAHLGHVFPDVKQSSGKWYCVNSGALNFKKK